MLQKINIATNDRVKILAEVFGETCSDTIIINPAIGVKRRMYHAFAEFMAAHNIATVLYNYRGMEDGLDHLPDGIQLDTEAWGRLDQSAVIEWANKELKPKRLLILGHSIGGQLPGFAANLGLVDGIIHVAAQKGDKQLWPISGRIKLYLLWHVLIPLMSRKKTFNAAKLGLGTYPWPASAASQWAAWGQKKNYLFNPTFAFDLNPWHDFNRPLLSLGFTDDHMAPEAAIDGLLSEYGKSLNENNDQRHIEKRIIKPQNLGLNSIGHFGFFKPEAKPLWQDTLKWIQNN